MSRGLNKAMLIGNVGADPEIRATSSGARVAKLPLATNQSWQDRSGEKREATEWHRLTVFGKLVDVVEQWVKKGDRLYVEGRIHYSTTEADDGTARYWTEIVVDRLVMLGCTPEDGRDTVGTRRGGQEAMRQASRASARVSGDSRGSTPPMPYAAPDDDLPF